ncbi:hypothetical protein DPEC_G00159480 [Dallia pectoralis]|uniref:Uncharacterized protein n=1 Tax=Dallia pectoralis TaxID=75939 RepID=A0ACC2GFX2_DALPE|nr:hypothetical protein DPEC_G00159480 [Dallia pectoralis]
MEKMHLLRGFINDRLIAAAEEIFGVVEKTIIEDHAEVVRLQKLLDVFLQPVIKLQRTDPQQLSLSGDEFPPDQQQCEEDWSPGLGHEDPESTQMKEEEQQTSQEEDQLQGPESYTESSIFTPAFEEDPTQPSNLYEALMDRSREADFLLISTAEQIKTEPDGEDYRQSELTSVSPQLSAVLPHCSAAHSENSGRVCGFSKKENLKVHQRTHTGERPYCCDDCGRQYITCRQLKAHMLTHRSETSYQDRNEVIDLDD